MIFYGYVLFGAVFRLICQVIIMVCQYHNGYSKMDHDILSLNTVLLVVLFLVDIFTWPETVLNIIWGILFHKYLPWRRKLYDYAGW